MHTPCRLLHLTSKRIELFGASARAKHWKGQHVVTISTKMSQSQLSWAPKSLMAALLLLLIIDGSSVQLEARPNAPRKPPFNGSMFGKRSNLSAAPDLEALVQQISENNVVLADLLVQQQESLLMALAAHCLGQARSPDLQQAVGTDNLCAQLMAAQQEAVGGGGTKVSLWPNRMWT